jgi:hypothetical protein
MDIDGTLRWVLWLIFVAFALFLYFSGPGQSGAGSGHLSLAIEVTLFALGTAAATLRAAKLYPEHDVRGGARPPRPTSLPFSWWHDFTGITVAIDQSHDLSRRLGDSTDNLHTRCTRWTWLTPRRHASLTPHTHNTHWSRQDGHWAVVMRLQSKLANVTVGVGRLGRASTVRFRANRTSGQHRRMTASDPKPS